MKSEKQIVTSLLVVVDCVAVCTSLLCAYYLRLWMVGTWGLIPLSHGPTFYLYRWWMILIVILSIAYHGGYGIIIDFWDDILALSKSTFIAFLLTWVALSLQKEAEMASRIVILLGFVLMAIILPVGRFAFKFLFFRLLDRRELAVLLGNVGDRERVLGQLLNREWYSGYNVLMSSVEQSAADQPNTCFLPIWNADDDTVKRIKGDARNVVLVTDIYGLSFMNTEIKSFLSENIALITSSNGLLAPEKMAIKRAFDLIASLFLFVFFIPFFLLAALAIRIESKGPIFFRHKRCGKNMGQFDMLKFRTMHPDADGMLERYISRNQEARQDWQEKNKLKDDPRVTRLGKILRKTSLDELPQLLNVIRGEMSLVGPRPDTRDALANFHEQYSEIYKTVKPGITGLWQVSGRSDVNYTKRVKLDYLYVLNWSLWLDLVIILKTAKAIITGKGAY
jgi:exopolysaccharide biosynthesis polyprenyl glycosylphosphotransferase